MINFLDGFVTQECRSACDKADGPQSYIAANYPDTKCGILVCLCLV